MFPKPGCKKEYVLRMIFGKDRIKSHTKTVIIKLESIPFLRANVISSS